jgi:pimeloyl-ACP methyl ester carboxylesterase
MEARLKLFEQDFIGATRAFVSQSFFTKNADPQFVEKIALDMSSAPADVAIAAIRGLNAWDPVAAAAGFDIPVIAINSDLGMPTNDELIKKTLPTFRSVTLSGTGHFLMMESPDSFNSVLLEQIAVLTGDTAT